MDKRGAGGTGTWEELEGPGHRQTCGEEGYREAAVQPEDGHVRKRWLFQMLTLNALAGLLTGKGVLSTPRFWSV